MSLPSLALLMPAPSKVTQVPAVGVESTATCELFGGFVFLAYVLPALFAMVASSERRCKGGRSQLKPRFHFSTRSLAAVKANTLSAMTSGCLQAFF